MDACEHRDGHRGGLKGGETNVAEGSAPRSVKPVNSGEAKKRAWGGGGVGERDQRGSEVRGGGHERELGGRQYVTGGRE